MNGPYSNYIVEYADGMRTGRVTVGKWIRLLYDYILDGLAEGAFRFDPRLANRAIDFIEAFVHHTKTRSDYLRLELWEKASISLIFGIVDDDGVRVFREVFLVVARKNGKSLLAAAIAAYMAYLDGEYGAEIYMLAPKLEQANIVYDTTYQIIKQEPELAALTDKRRTEIYIEESNTSIRRLAFSAKKSDGFSPHLAVCDELASWPAAPGLRQYDVMASALGARRQPLILGITTAGYVNDGIYDELMKRSTAFLLGSAQKRERRLLPILYMIDDAAKWNDLEELKKANPNLGVSVSASFLEDEIVIAENSAPKRAEFLTKYCNIKQNSAAAWMSYGLIHAISGEAVTLEDFRGCYCVGGIDLSQTTDLTACCVVIEREGLLYTFAQFFMPKNRIAELQEREGVPYELYVSQGLITPSGENYVDYHDCFAWFRRLVEEYEILPLQVGYDRYSAQYLVQDMDAYGFHMDDVYQGENLTPVIHEADGLIRDRTLRLGKNSLLQAHFLNVAMKQNTETRKVRPVKIDERCHIDGFVAVIDALTVRQKWYAEIGEQLKNAA